MKSKLLSPRRKKRALNVPRPQRKGNIKVTYEGWVECAKHTLIEEGIAAVKVDRLAKRLKVTRGGFYYHFKNQGHLLEVLLDKWRRENLFTPARLDTSSPKTALQTLEQMTDAIVHERGFDPQFDMAIREWARISDHVAEVVVRVDEERMKALHQIFLGLGCERKEAEIRARVFYYHQIGYYALGVEEDTRTREANLSTYLNVLCGQQYIQAAKAFGNG